MPLAICPTFRLLIIWPDLCFWHLGYLKDLASTFHQKAERFTLYASSVDKAILASKVIHKHPRAGDADVELVIVDSVDTVDATAVDTSFMGHSY